MKSKVSDPVVAAALDQIHAGLDALAGAEAVDAKDAAVRVREFEVVGRRVRAVQVREIDAIDRRGLHRVDGHGSAKVFVRHHGQLSEVEAGRREKAMKALRDLPVVAREFADGNIGVCQVGLISMVHSNRRVWATFCRLDENVAAMAMIHCYELFKAKLRDWERLIDEDGTRDRNQRSHENRDGTMVQDYGGAWNIKAGCAALQGAQMRPIWDRYIAAELDADWVKARAFHGDAATVDDLERTDAQRRFDALHAMFMNAAAGFTAAHGGLPMRTNVVIDEETFERELARLSGAPPQGPRALCRTLRGELLPIGASPDYRCRTIEGHWLEPTETVAAALLGKLRRVVLNAQSVVIDLGRYQRLFTGNAADAIRLSLPWCAWPGCHVSAHQCQNDHLRSWKQQGRTSPVNGTSRQSHL